MLRAGSAMFLLIPESSSNRVLHPGNVLSVEGDLVTAEFTEKLSPSAGLDVNTFSDIKGKFFQQGAIVASVLQAEPVTVLTLKTVGSPVSAEQRGMFRVSAAGAGIQGRVNRSRTCTLADASLSGLAVTVNGEFPIGSIVDVSITYNDKTIDGRARVQTARLLANGSRRYGLLLPESQTAMRRLLQTITVDLQRAQLRRLAKSA